MLGLFTAVTLNVTPASLATDTSLKAPNVAAVFLAVLMAKAPGAGLIRAEPLAPVKV